VSAIKKIVFAVFSLAPSFSWVKTGGSMTQPLQRFIRSRKTAEAVENHGRAKHPAKAGC
jgi:hypothetical protein